MPSKKTFFFALFVSVIILLVGYLTQPQGTFIVACDVGQGDGVYMRIDTVDVVVDAGQTGAILSCLGKYMPMFDRTIDVIIISHPQIDHYGGFKQILQRYRVLSAVLPPVINENQSYPELLAQLQHEHVTTHIFYGGDSVKFAHGMLSFIWPTKEYASLNSTQSVKSASGQVLGTTTDDLNNFSSLFVFSQGGFDMLFTGDASPKVLSLAQNSSVLDDSIEILKVPHHGSRNGLTAQFLAEVSPRFAVISAGRKNRFGHPHRQIIEMLEGAKIPYQLTAKEGDVVIEVGKNGWTVRE